MQVRRDAKLELLKGVPLFAKCSKAELRQISILADEFQFDENRTLIREGTRGREFFVLVDGVLPVTRNGQQVSVLSAGDLVGELALVTDVPRTTTVSASTPVHLLVLTHRGFLDLLEQSPSIAVKVLQSLGGVCTQMLPARGLSRSDQHRFCAASSSGVFSAASQIDGR